MDRMLHAAADLAREYGVHWVGAEHLARMVLRHCHPRERLTERAVTDAHAHLFGEDEHHAHTRSDGRAVQVWRIRGP